MAQKPSARLMALQEAYAAQKKKEREEVQEVRKIREMRMHEQNREERELSEAIRKSQVDFRFASGGSSSDSTIRVMPSGRERYPESPWPFLDEHRLSEEVQIKHAIRLSLEGKSDRAPVLSEEDKMIQRALDASIKEDERHRIETERRREETERRLETELRWEETALIQRATIASLISGLEKAKQMVETAEISVGIAETGRAQAFDRFAELVMPRQKIDEEFQMWKKILTKDLKEAEEKKKIAVRKLEEARESYNAQRRLLNTRENLFRN
jgi:hypothetical protein